MDLAIVGKLVSFSLPSFLALPVLFSVPKFFGPNLAPCKGKASPLGYDHIALFFPNSFSPSSSAVWVSVIGTPCCTHLTVSLYCTTRMWALWRQGLSFCFSLHTQCLFQCLACCIFSINACWLPGQRMSI